jgi:Omp85 superfamily domain
MRLVIHSLLLSVIIIIIAGATSFGQNNLIQTPPDTLSKKQEKSFVDQRDVIDIVARLIKSPGAAKHNAVTEKTGRIHVSVAPGIGYTLSTGFAAIIASNAAFYTSESEDAKLSNIFADVVYTQNHQLITHMQGNLWTKGNAYNIVTDWRYLKYPQATFGLGGTSDSQNSFDQDYSYLRLYQTVLKNVGKDFYAGFGYSLDYHWNVTETSENPGAISDSQLYGLSETSVSSGINLNILYDNRDNSINPDKGMYINVLYRPNFKALGSDEDWQSLRVDIRKYVRFPCNSENVLAFWNFNWLTLSGNPPYLDLPSTGWDPYNNLGRGYIQGRFRGKNMLYFETEYRFKVARNGLIGGVVFANAQCISEWPSNTFEKINPAAGLGLRLKFNKHSKTNVAIDYGFGADGSRGFFVNLGEVF